MILQTLLSLSKIRIRFYSSKNLTSKYLRVAVNTTLKYEHIYTGINIKKEEGKACSLLKITNHFLFKSYYLQKTLKISE